MAESKKKKIFSLSVMIREIMLFHQEESVSAAEFDWSLFCSTERQIRRDRHEAMNQSYSGLGWGKIWILDSGWWG